MPLTAVPFRAFDRVYRLGQCVAWRWTADYQPECSQLPGLPSSGPTANRALGAARRSHRSEIFAAAASQE